MGDADCQKVTVRYEGCVQGVGFRYTVQEYARRYALTGYVENTWDGAVQLVVEGGQNKVRALLKDIRSGRLSRYIEGVSENWASASGRFVSFSIKG